MAELRFAGVRKDYGSVRALRGLDLEVGDGEFLVLVGPSGSGKSTVLRAAAGLEEVTAGSIHIGARDVTRLSPAKRSVSMVFQNYALFPHLSVAQNIGFGLRARRVPRSEARASVAAAAKLVGCDALLDRNPYQISGGERQRVALARALVRDPDVFLLDEPLSSLDAQLRIEMRAELKRLQRRIGATMAYVTHDQVEALTMGDRVAVLREGVIEQTGTPDEIYRRPANRFVAQFIGSPAMNFFEASLADGPVPLRAGPFEFATVPERLRSRASGVVIGIRPEHVRVTVDGERPRAEVQIVEMAGSETYLHLGAGGSTFIARVGSDLRPPVGATVDVSASLDDAYFFDALSGVTLA